MGTSSKLFPDKLSFPGTRNKDVSRGNRFYLSCGNKLFPKEINLIQGNKMRTTPVLFPRRDKFTPPSMIGCSHKLIENNS